jgi:hypothetical protein
MKHMLLVVLVLIILTGCAPSPAQTTVQPTPPARDVIHQLATDVPFNIDTSTQGHLLNLEQTINGVTVTLHWGYTDGERVVLGYTVQSAAGLRPEPGHMGLRSSAGDRFQPHAGNVVVGPSDILSEPVPAGYGAFLQQFRPQQSGKLATPLQLHFLLQVNERRDPVQGEPQASIIAESSAGTIVHLQPAPPPVSQSGPFTFEFTLPPD